MALSKEQFLKLRRQGLSVDQIVRFERGETPTSTPRKQESFLTGLAKGIAKPFVKAGVTAVQATRGVGFLASGQTEKAKQLVSQPGLDVPGFGKVEPLTIKKPLEILGAGAEIASFGVGGGAGFQTSKQAIRGGIKQAAKFGAKRGAQVGALTGAGVGLQEEKPTVGGVVGRAAFGGLTGLAVGGAFPIGLRGGQKLFGGVKTLVTRPIKKTISETGKAITRKKTQALEVTKEKLLGKREPLESIVAPKLTQRARESLISSGKVTRGKQGIFRKQPDIIDDKKIAGIAKTVRRVIPGAEKLDDIAIANQSNKKIGSLSKALVPKMTKVVLKSNRIRDLSNTWNALKKEQQKGIDFTSFSKEIVSVQNKFLSLLNRLRLQTKRLPDNKIRTIGFTDLSKIKKDSPVRTTSNLNDIWDIRKAFDKAIPSRIKAATNESSDAAQVQQTAWLQLRTLLNDLINDSATGLGKISERSFKDMSNLYQVIQNISTKAPVEIERATKGAIRGGVEAVKSQLSPTKAIKIQRLR